MNISVVAFEAAWVLARFSAANHRVHLCSGASLTCRRRPTSITLDNTPPIKHLIILAC